ncbi:putative caleosin domain protein [Diaporthe ampelina]|uniref:Putative caleosin domain protein n=1 Tax=Diaporthe ampelina TaxID=1214573 RepID=A0A0G2HC30_9PEZI|nr:putative caleosin domain protein [Diaporthe ampelina]
MSTKPPSQVNGDTTLPFDISAANSTPTQTRVPSTKADSLIRRIATPRANAAVSTTSPEGDTEYTRRFKDYTVLQQHVLFWDRDADGQIYPWDTYTGFRELGFNAVFSLLALLIIHSGFSYPTRLAYSWLPDPLFRVYVGSIHKAKHGSDSETYDSEGRFRPQQFEDMFAKYGKSGDGTLTLGELFQLMHGNRNAMDPFGWGAALFEFGTTWLLIQRDGKCYKEDVRGVYDGSMFWRVREERTKGRGWNQGWGIGGDRFAGSVKV